MQRTKCIILAAVAAGAATGVAGANVIVSYVNFGQPGDQITSPTGTVGDNVTDLPLTRGPGLSPNVGSNSLNSSGWDTLSADDYVTFGFTVDAGYWADLDSLWFGSRSSNSGPGELAVFYSGDSFTNPIFSFTQSGTAFGNHIADLSALQGLTGTVEFRIYATSDIRADGTPGISPAGTFRVGDHFDGANFTEFRITGDVIPAPGALALLGIAGLCATRRRR